MCPTATREKQVDRSGGSAIAVENREGCGQNQNECNRSVKLYHCEGSALADMNEQNGEKENEYRLTPHLSEGSVLAEANMRNKEYEKGGAYGKAGGDVNASISGGPATSDVRARP